MKKLLVLALVCLAVVSCKKEEDDYNNGNNGNTVYTPCPNDSGYTCIPDPNFEQALIDLGYDDVVDGQVSTANISDVDSLNVNSKGITDLTGIDDFSDLNYLYCYDNQLTSLDLSQNAALISLYCWYNQLTNLDLSQNTYLEDFWCNGNQLTSLDVTNNIALTTLVCPYNQLTSLNLSGCTALEILHCNYTQLTSLDVSGCTALTDLYCYDNQLTSLDVSNNIALTHLECVDNQLTCLNVKNGNNTNFTNFYAGDNPNLTCIEVDDPAWSIQNWTYIDNGVTFSTNCNYPAGCF